MKILIITPYVACNHITKLSRYKGGFGYMVYDIANSISLKERVCVYTTHVSHKQIRDGRLTFIKTSFLLFFIYCLNYINVSTLLSIFKRYRLPLREVVYLLYNTVQLGYLKHVIKEGNFDIVHIHGWEFNNEQIMRLCESINIPYLITLHGLNSISDSINIDKSCKMNEQDFIRYANGKNIPVSVISSGIKASMAKICGVESIENVRVIGNAFSFNRMSISQNIREIYNIPATAKILLYVGNITRNKNQQQAIEAFDLMSPIVCENTYILFLGRNIEHGYTVDDFISKSQYSSHLIMCGNIDKDVISNYYKECDGVILLSHAEGFGLSLIEGMHFGKPSICFTDIDAFNDIYDCCAMIGIPERSNAAVAESCQQLLTYDWNHDKIIQYSKKFSLENMAGNYINFYNDIIR